MPDQYCFVCASNEGVFLDVTPDNRDTFGDQIETCLSSKINECIDLSSKICYKCAYELDQCAKFVQKYKKSHEISERKAATSRPCCFLCHELVDSNRIFDITKDNNVLFNPLQKIRSIFNDDISKKNTRLKLICLSCRYNLDVLYDLRKVYQETIANLKALINEEINYSNFPKVHTDVVNRKTTITTFPDITFYGTVNSDSDSNDNTNMARRGKRRLKGHKAQINAQIKLRNNKPKVRTCDNCHGAVANGIDMYRFYHTGLTVCKNCWITIDPSSDKIRRSRQTQSYLAETKLCAVFLTDVLSQKSHRKKKMHEVEKNKNDNTSHESSQEEEKSAGSSSSSLVSSKRNHIVNGKARRGRKRRINIMDRSQDIEYTPSKMTRLSKERANTNEVKSTKASVDAEQQSSTHLTQRRGRKRTIDDRSTDSDGSLEQRETRSSKLNDRVNKTNRKKQKSILEETTSYARLDSSDETSNEDGRSLRSKTKGATSLSTVHIKNEREERPTGSRTRSSSISSTEMTSMEFKSPKSLAQSEAKMEYACDKCDKKFDTKLSNAKHRLTHLKQAALKLEKLTVSSVKEKQETEVDSQDDNISKEATSRPDRTAGKHPDDPSEEIDVNIEDTDDEEIFSLSTRKNSTKKVKNETGNEDCNVIDKPEDNTARSESRVEEESANDENIETNESEQCEKSTDMPDETLEIEDDKDEKDEEKRDKHTEDKDETSVNRDSDESKDEDVQKTAVTVVEDEANVDEEKDKEIEDDAKVSSIENEKAINECNNDEEDLHEETTRDSETIRSPILSIHETSKDIEDHESCENNLEDNCEDYKDGMVDEPDKDEIMDEPDEDEIMDEPDKDETIIMDEPDEDEIMDEPDKDEMIIMDEPDEVEIIMDEPDKVEIMDETEMPQCDLMDEFSKEDTKEPEEDFLEILPTDKTDTLNDQRDLDDTIVNEDKEFEIEELEKQNRFDEENMEAEISADVDEPNSARDTIKPDLSNGEKHDEIRDSDDDDVAFVPVNNDSNDDRAKCNNITEETVSIDDLKEKRKLEEEIKELEQLVDDNAMNNRHSKIQENSTYVLDTSSADAANEILREVFELAAAEVQHREDSSNTKNSDDVTISETLENISREIRKSADMPSLDPISVMELDDDIILN